MSHYEQTLLAYGVDPATARRDAFINEVGRLLNRERYAAEQSDDGIDYRDGFSMKYGAALGAD